MKSEDFGELHAAASDPLIWEQHPEHDRYKEEKFRKFFDSGIECGGAFVILDAATDEVIGSSRYNGLDIDSSQVEIGWTFLRTKYWGGLYNRELKRLMLDHAFQFVDNVLFYIGPNNNRSRRAVEKIGATLVGTSSRFGSDSVVYRLTKSDYKLK